MRRMVFDLGEVRLQAPEAGFDSSLAASGSCCAIRVVPRRSSSNCCIGSNVSTGGLPRLPPAASASLAFSRRPISAGAASCWKGPGASRRCSVHIGFIEWQQGQRSQLGCRLDLDLDGDRQRSRILGALFSPTAETSVYEVGHLVQYLENDGRPCWPPPCAGSGGGSPFSERTHRW